MAHPLILALVALDAVAALLLLAAAVPAAKVMLDWRPGASDPRQLALERRLEAGALQARLATFAWALSTVIFAVAVAGVLPDLVPGAMCGTGVMTAMGGSGSRALLLRLVAALALGAWHLVDRLDRARPDGEATEAAARALLLAVPIALLAAWDALGAFGRLDTHTAVDCCAVVYDATREGGALSHLAPGQWLWAAGVLGAGVLVTALSSALRPRPGLGATALALLAPLWALAAGGALVNVLAAYRYEVLAHHCPWCLFLAEHGRVGYPLFGAMIVIALEGGAAGLAGRIAGGRPALLPAAQRRIRRAGVRALVALAIYGWLAVGPAIQWRLSTGVWL